MSESLFKGFGMDWEHWGGEHEYCMHCTVKYLQQWWPLRGSQALSRIYYLCSGKNWALCQLFRGFDPMIWIRQLALSIHLATLTGCEFSCLFHYCTFHWNWLYKFHLSHLPITCTCTMQNAYLTYVVKEQFFIILLQNLITNLLRIV